MKQKAEIGDSIVLNQYALRRHRDQVSIKHGRIEAIDYEFSLGRYLYAVSFIGHDLISLWSYEFDKVK